MITRSRYMKTCIQSNTENSSEIVPKIQVYIKPKKSDQGEKIKTNQLTLQTIKVKPLRDPLFRIRIRPIGCWNSITEQSESFYALNSQRSSSRPQELYASSFYTGRKTSRFQMRNHEVLSFLKASLKKKFTKN